VLRQIDYLAPRYDLTVIGYGSRDPSWPPLEWRAIPEQSLSSKIGKLFWFALGRVLPRAYEAWYWRTARHRLALQHAVASGADAFHANDWPALPVAVEAARLTGGRVVFHIHEYAEQESDNNPLWRHLVSPSIRHLHRKYTSQAAVPIDASLTVCRPIAERYRRELGLDPIVVYNAPRPVDVPLREATGASPPDGEPVRLIHHGYAKRGRALHRMIQAVALADRRFVLDLMLVDDDRGYLAHLRRLAERVAPGRVGFRAPVRPWEIVERVAAYDVGLCVIDPSTYNNLMMLPNKLFEYIQAGLAVCVGPSPAMVELVQRYGVGVVAPGFAPADIARTLDRLTPEGIATMRRAARLAATELNADVEMAKVVDIYRRLLDEEAPSGEIGGSFGREIGGRAGGQVPAPGVEPGVAAAVGGPGRG
jgi:glycosyltransferase involved in cell wall biosynthesis